jgi:hypothetical protein
MIKESRFQFSAPIYVFTLTFYKTFRPALSLTEPSVEWLCNDGGGGGVLFCRGLSHTLQDNH